MGEGRSGGVFADVEAVGDAAAQFGDMADDPDGAVVGAQGVQDVEDLVEGVLVEGAEAFVDEERVQGVAASFVGDDVGQSESQGQGSEEGFASGERVGLAGAAGPGVGDLEPQAGAAPRAAWSSEWERV